jgi:hypothetical protein
MNSMRDVVQPFFADEKARTASSRMFSERDYGIFFALSVIDKDILPIPSRPVYKSLHMKKKDNFAQIVSSMIRQDETAKKYFCNYRREGQKRKSELVASKLLLC